MTFGIHNFPLPIIITPRLLLQTPHMVESAIHEYINAVDESLPEISQWLPWAKFCPSLTQVAEHIKNCKTSWITQYNNYTGLQLWILDKIQNKFLGNITLWNVAWNIPKCEFDFWTRTSATHQGYITEALNALLRYCFSQIDFQRIEIRCEKQNHRAQIIAQHLGFELDDTLRNGELTDVLVFSRINANNLPELSVTWSPS